MQISKKQIRKIIGWLILVLSAIGFVLVIYEEGFKRPILSQRNSLIVLKAILTVIWGGYVGLYFMAKTSKLFTKKYLSELVVILLISFALGFIFSEYNLPWFSPVTQTITDRILVSVLTVLVFVLEVSKVSLKVNQLKINPSMLFILSFLLLILLGTIFLMLPNAHYGRISMIDAVFTATSAVCVTGLIVLDTAKDFTLFGQLVILFLFQLGGLGMMTFTSFFGFFFRSSFSLQNQLFLKDFINEDNFSKIFSTLMKIISFTFLVEGVTIVLIFFTLDDAGFSQLEDKVFFSIFHGVSAFCNAGFSTLSNGLYQEGFRGNFDLHLILAISIVLGGIGFPVVVSYYSYLKHVIIGFVKKVFLGEAYRHVPRVVNIGTRLVMYTTLAFLVFGFVVYWFAEQNHTLDGLSPYGKIVTSIFGTVTPRTAGFNTVDMGALSMSTIVVMILLMYVGASPGSTGGGLKTSTFAVAMLNAFSMAKGKDRVEFFKREISNITLRKAFAVIALSFLVIGLAIFLVVLFEPEKPILKVAFEVFSAFSTVGLSLGITAGLGTFSKIVLIFTMFIGRVGTLTILIAFSRAVKNLSYRYPEESVFIT
ncbi:potassium transporter TrkG [Echinicola jeungdonensis]|uniref:TrkH family potassium uptake protein n=1 Tax=Echinicola jeungdonensis TaxID=709343 RepID=A0ABV5J9I6_9BACT|nr:potassium transporter TrkG [Echinicola jeungdonensis]MDN3669409.1 potassium transporter TrkG [Echinicola jeungdonensis]